MTTTMPRAPHVGQRASSVRPHVRKGVAEILRLLMGLETPKAAQCRMDRIRADLPKIATAFHLSNDPLGINAWASPFDNIRNHGVALPLTMDLVRNVARAERRQDEAREIYLSEQTREHLLALDRRLSFEISQKQELQLAVRATLEAQS